MLIPTPVWVVVTTIGLLSAPAFAGTRTPQTAARAAIHLVVAVHDRIQTALL
jgi:hypothetical protein